MLPLIVFVYINIKLFSKKLGFFIKANNLAFHRKLINCMHMRINNRKSSKPQTGTLICKAHSSNRIT